MNIPVIIIKVICPKCEKNVILSLKEIKDEFAEYNGYCQCNLSNLIVEIRKIVKRYAE